MKFISLLLFTLLLPGMIQAADLSGVTRFSGKLLQDESIQLDTTLASSPKTVTTDSKVRADDKPLSESSSTVNQLASRGISTQFEIFDAWVELSGDIDNDDYFHRIKTTFDADVNTPLETVYAKLYLSYEGGPWQQVASSDLFEIKYDSVDDTYEIVTELIEGYEQGFYDVLIELHSFYHTGVVASRVLYQDIEGYPITLEDLQHDENVVVIVDDPYYPSENGYIETGVYVGGGSFSWIGLIVLGILLIIKFRYFQYGKRSRS